MVPDFQTSSFQTLLIQIIFIHSHSNHLSTSIFKLFYSSSLNINITPRRPKFSSRLLLK
ncbi:Orf22 [Heliothis zea nudivirus]|uniref:Orf22 n=1 Tax=Heliothis zea nudivirus 1 TaxID=3116536 RepID=Q8JKT9_9VIRU|nr:Orf22 [Heliothis zea nudivirus]AAN04317.1 Orf22 [Heliothis zea nudivirus]